MNQLVTSAPMLPGMVSDESISELIAQFTTESDGRMGISINRLPTVDERTALERRHKDLEALLVPVGRTMTEDADVMASPLGRAVSTLFAGQGSARGDAAGRTEDYAVLLSDLPLWAIQRACDDFRRGMVSERSATGQTVLIGMDHAPSAPRVHVQASKYTEGVAREAMAIARILRARKLIIPPISEERRKAIGAKFQMLGDQLRGGGQRRDGEDAERAEAERERQRLDDAAKDAARHEQMLRGQYADVGLEPIVGQAGILISLEMAVKLGLVVCHERKTGPNAAVMLSFSRAER